MDIIKAYYTFSRQYLYKLNVYIVYITNCVPKESMARITLYGFQFFYTQLINDFE